MLDRASMVADYDQKVHSGMTILRTAAVEAGAKKILAGMARYQAIEKLTGVPWYFIGALHYRESTCDFSACLANGQSIGRVTTIEPKGAGPWATWEDSAVWALQHEGFLSVTDWTGTEVWGVCLFEGERFNGEGYHNHGWANPYLFSGTDLYSSGKYIRDGVYDPSVVDIQIGIAPLMKRVLQISSGVYAPVVIAGSKGALHPVDAAAVKANSRYLRASDWYSSFCEYLGLSGATLWATVSQVQPFLTDWKTLTVVGVLGGAYVANKVGAFNLMRAASQGRYTPSGLSPTAVAAFPTAICTTPAAAPVAA